MTERGASHRAWFAMAKFRPTTLPSTLLSRSALHDRLTAGAGKRLTVVVGSAGAGKSVLLSSWVAARPPGTTSWLSCDEADADPVRFWAGFVEAPRVWQPEFGADAADLLGMDAVMSADVIASIANDAATLPAGSAIIVDDFHLAARAVSKDMTSLVEHWPAQTVQLILASRFDPPLRLHRWRLAGELCELRDRDLYFSLAESRDLLARFGVAVSAADLGLLHQRSEGWAAALQMAALSLRGATDPARAAQALDLDRHAIADYFIAEVLDQQPPEVAQFMLDTSVLAELTADACAAVTERLDAAALLRNIDAANLFVVALDDEQTTFRYHHLVRRALHAELRARDPAREQALQLRAAEWFGSARQPRHAARHLLAAKQADRALALLQDRVVTDYMRDPEIPPALDVSMVNPSLLADAPDRLLGLAVDLLLYGDVARGGEYLDVLERAQPSIEPNSRLAARLAAARSLRYTMTGQADQAVREALAARAIQQRAQLDDEWLDTIAGILLRAYMVLEDFAAVEREAATALAKPELAKPVKLVLVPAAQALARFESGRLAEAADAAEAAEVNAEALGFGAHFFAVDYLDALAGLALERRDLDTAERYTERALAISEHRRPVFEFLALLDRARVWAARGQAREAEATVAAARQALAVAHPMLRARADELEAELRMAAGDLRTPAKLASGLPAERRSLLLAKVALAADDYQAAREHLQALTPGDLTPRRALASRLLRAAVAIGGGDPAAAHLAADALDAARSQGFLNTVVTTAPQLTSYLVEHSRSASRDSYMEQLVAAALEVRASRPAPSPSQRTLPEPLTPAELRILRLLPVSTYPQMAATLGVSRNTIKTHLRAVYQKLGVESRSEAIEKASHLGLL